MPNVGPKALEADGVACERLLTLRPGEQIRLSNQPWTVRSTVLVGDGLRSWQHHQLRRDGKERRLTVYDDDRLETVVVNPTALL